MYICAVGSKKPHYYDEVEICVSSIDKNSESNFSALNATTPPAIFEALYTETTLISESSDNTQNNSVPPVLSSQGEKSYYNDEMCNSGEQRNGTTSEVTEVTYDVPQAKDSAGVNDHNSYSSLGPIDYSILQPHIPKPIQQQLPPTDDQYSCLQH